MFAKTLLLYQIAGRTGQVCRVLLFQRVNLKIHFFQITQNPRIGCDDTRCVYACNGARIYQCRISTFNVCKFYHFGDMAVAAADEIIISGASHAATIMRVVGNENTPTTELQCCIHPVVNKVTVGFGRQVGNGHHVAKVVAVYYMHAKAKLERGSQCIGAN